MSEPVSLELLCALAELTALEREVVVEHHLRGVPVSSIAERRGCSRGAVYQVLRKSHAKLATALEPDRENLLAA